MSKIRTEDVFKLIQSMSGSEKRHFNLFSSRHVAPEKNKSLRLFDLLEAQTECDEAAIMKEEIFSDRKNFSDLRGHLYKTILQALDYFHYEETAEKKIKNLIRYIGILKNRGLTDQAEKILEKAKAMAKEHQKHLLLLELSEYESTLMQVSADVKKMDKSITTLFREKKQLINRYTNLLQFQMLARKYYWHLLRDTKYMINKNVQQKKIFSNTLMAKEQNALSFSANYLYHYILRNKWANLKKYDKAYEHAKKKNELVNKHPLIADDEPHIYHVQPKISLLICELQLKKYKEAENTLRAVQEVKIKNNYQKIRTPYYILALELRLYLESTQFEKGTKKIQEIKEMLDKIPLRFGNKYTELLLLWRSACIYFFSGQYSDSNRYLNLIINDTQKQLRPDIVMLASLMRLLVQKEFGNEDYLEYEAKSLIQTVHAQKSKFGMMTAIIEFLLTQLPKLTDKRSMQNMLTDIKKKISKIPKDHSEALQWHEFPIVEWLESKIESRSLAEIVKDKVRKEI